MPAIYLDDVPEDLHSVLAARAAVAGESVAEYVLELLRDEVGGSSTSDGPISAGGHVPLEVAVRLVRSDRGR